EVITTQGETGLGFFVIEDGNASVSRDEQVVRNLGPGDFFGEVALIDEGPRSATVVATTDLSCRGMTAWEFKPFVEEHPDVAGALLQPLASARARPGPAPQPGPLPRRGCAEAIEDRLGCLRRFAPEQPAAARRLVGTLDLLVELEGLSQVLIVAEADPLRAQEDAPGVVVLADPLLGVRYRSVRIRMA